MTMMSQQETKTEVVKSSKTEVLFKVLAFGLLVAAIAFTALKFTNTTELAQLDWWLGLSPLWAFMIISVVVTVTQQRESFLEMLTSTLWGIALYGTVAFVILKATGVTFLAGITWWVAFPAIPVALGIVFVVGYLSSKFGKKNTGKQQQVTSAPGLSLDYIVD